MYKIVNAIQLQVVTHTTSMYCDQSWLDLFGSSDPILAPKMLSWLLIELHPRSVESEGSLIERPDRGHSLKAECLDRVTMLEGKTDGLDQGHSLKADCPERATFPKTTKA